MKILIIGLVFVAACGRVNTTKVAQGAPEPTATPATETPDTDDEDEPETAVARR